jgi:hypothetical protein
VLQTLFNIVTLSYTCRSSVVPPAGFEPALPPPEAGRCRDRGRLLASYLGFLFAFCVSDALRCAVVGSTGHSTATVLIGRFRTPVPGEIRVVLGRCPAGSLAREAAAIGVSSEPRQGTAGGQLSQRRPPASHFSGHAEEVGESAVPLRDGVECLVDMRERECVVFEDGEVQCSGAGHVGHVLGLAGGEPEAAQDAAL